MAVASSDVYTDIAEGLFLLQLPHESQLFASASSSLPLTQSSHAFVPPALPSTHCLPTTERERGLSDATIYDYSDR
ncbi:hypothetical protein N7466_003359 [Penicillium verhagenii]|uniref:uncharacterized protein n=1 Tax=Penicillium verhagenii TaxID=1562060 RepID=UPI0025454375|nr:uncharacterized protein N7466_003359 [Penicillium verhagenii]KAJ5936909.1 hypothetical protein N7466_003359 [Penicillium verhagenii]